MLTSIHVQGLGTRILDSKRKISQGEALGLKEVATMDAEVVARYVETKVTIDKNRGKAKSYDDKQLDVAINHLLGLIKQEPKMGQIPAKPKYPDWSFNRDVCAKGDDGSAAAAAARAAVKGETR